MKKSLAVLLVVAMLLCAVPFGTLAAADETITGTFSGLNNLSFHYTKDNGISTYNGNTLKNNVSIVEGSTVTAGYSDGVVVKYDHLKNSYCDYNANGVDHRGSKNWNNWAYNVCYIGRVDGSVVRLENNKTYTATLNYYAVKLDTTVSVGLVLCNGESMWEGAGEKVTYKDITAATAGWQTLTFDFTTPASGGTIPFLYLKLAADENATVYFDNYSFSVKKTLGDYSADNDTTIVDENTYIGTFTDIYPDPAFQYTADIGIVDKGTGNTHKNNISLVNGTTVTSGYTDGVVIKYDHLKGAYSSYPGHEDVKVYNHWAYNCAFMGLIGGNAYKLKAGASYLVTVDYNAVTVDTPVKVGLVLCKSTNMWGGRGEPNYYETISAASSGWQTLSFVITADTADGDIPFLMSTPTADENVTIYYDNLTFTEVPTVVLVGEDGSVTEQQNVVGAAVKFPEANAQYDVTNPDGTGYTVTGTKWYYDKEFTAPVDTETVKFTAERKIHYYAKTAKHIDYADNQISYVGFENSTVIPENGVLDATNNYVITKYSGGYKEFSDLGMESGKWANPTDKTDIRTIYGSGKGMSGNFSIVEGGLNSAHALKYKQLDGENSNIAYKMVDIGGGVLWEDNTTYNVSFYYKAAGDTVSNIKFEVLSTRSNWHYGHSSSVSIGAGDVATDWTRVDITYTTDFSRHNANYAYSSNAWCLPALRVNAGIDNTAIEIYIDNISVSKAVSSAGASVLNRESALISGKQAIRFFFDYKANADGTVNINGVNKTVKERGILIQNKDARTILPNTDGEYLRSDCEAAETLTKYYMGLGSVVGITKTTDLDELWSYSGGTATFSAYVKGFLPSDCRKFSVRGYIMLSDNTVLYSDIKDYSVDYIVNQLTYENMQNTYSFTDSAVRDKVKFQSATELTDKGVTLDWTASAVIVKAKCTGRVSFNMYVPKTPENLYFTVYVDGERLPTRYQPTVVDAANKIYAVTFDMGENAGLHEIELVRQTQVNQAQVDLISVELQGELLKTEQNEQLIEFLGDSITCAHGNIALDTEERAIGTDPTQGYAYLTAKALGVDYRIRSRSGIGIRKGYAGTSKTADWISGYTTENAFRSDNAYTEDRAPDVVCIYLGTNDLHFITDMDAFYQNIKTLAGIVREANPNAKIVWIGGGMTDKYNTMASDAMAELGGSAQGYYYHKMPSGMNGDSTGGAQGHPSVSQHQKMSETLVDFLKENGLIA